MVRSIAAALALAALPAAAPAQPRGAELSRGLLASYPLAGDAVDEVTRAPAEAVGVRPTEGRDGRPRGALSFDGARAWLDLGDRLAPQRFAISAWIRPEGALDRPQVIVSRIRNLPGHYQRNLELRLEAGGRLLLHVPSGAAWEAAEGRRAIAPGRWTHVAAVYDGARAQLFVDGTKDGAPLDVVYAQSRSETFVGARPEGGGRDGRTPAGPTFFFRGALAEVAIWDRPLAEAEIALLARGASPRDREPPPAAGAELLASYPLDGDARDAAGGADGRVVGAARPAADRRGDPRGALALSGKEYVDLGTRTDPERFTLSAWIRPTRADRDLVVLSKWSSVPGPRDRWLELRVDAGGRITLALPGGGPGGRPQTVRSSRAVAANRWTFVAATYDGERAVLHLDGQSDAAAALAPFEASAGPVFLGARPDASGKKPRLGTGFEGSLDDVRVHRGALGERELQALFRDRGPAPAPGPGPTPDDDADAEVLLVKVDRLVARHDAAVLRRGAAAALKVEGEIVEALEAAERDARAEKNAAAAGHLRRALGELQAARGRADAVSLDRKRSALVGLAESLWTDAAEALERDGHADERGGERGGEGPRRDPGGDGRRGDPWR